MRSLPLKRVSGRILTRKPRAFILVAVLLLIALVTVLVAVTSFLARIERRAVFNAARVEAARQNALFGMNIALAQLQKEAGPDQRVTARADILDTNPSTNAADGFPSTAAWQGYWTGVWKTGNAPPDASYVSSLPASASVPTPQRTTSLGSLTPTTAQKVASAKWLVSDPIDPSTNSPIVLDPTATIPSTIKTVALAKNLPDLTGASSAVSVSAPLVTTYSSAASTTSAGKYAYWVSDEGVKAKPNLIDPTYTGSTSANSTFVQSQLHAEAPQSVAAQNGLLGTNAKDLRQPKYAGDIAKVGTLQSLGYVQGTDSTPAVTGMTGTNAAQFSADVTTSSYGVLADVRNGGLKVDLSQLFEDPTNQFAPYLTALASTHTVDSAADQKVWAISAGSFDASNSDSNPAEFGIRWQSLYNYYSLYKDLSSYPSTSPWSNIDHYSGGNPGTTTPSMDARIFSYTANPIGTVGATTSQELGESYMPHVLGFGIYFSMTSVQLPPTGANPHNYSLIMYAEPRVILYNPYNVTLTASLSPYTTSLTTNVLGHSWTVKVNGTAILNEAPTWKGTSAGANQDISFTTAGSANYVLKPGEIRVYGLATLAQASSFGNIASFGNIGDQVGQAQWQYLGTDAATVVTPNSATQWQANTPDSADVSVTFTGGSGLWSNNGVYQIVNVGPGVWPNGSTSATKELGRFFNGPPNEKVQTADLGPISGMVSTSPSPSAAKPFGYFVIRAKGLSQNQTANASLQPLPTFSSSDGAFNPLPTYWDNTMVDTDFALAVQNPTSLTEMQVAGSSPPFQSFWGSQDVALSATDPSYLILRDVPRQPMLSLGQFMHLPMRTSSRIASNQIDTSSCLMGVGGSLADPYFPLTSVWGNNNGSGVATFDDNFLMNQALFDTYYFSTVPPPPGNMDNAYKNVLPALAGSTAAAFNNTNVQNGTCVLPNSRMRFYAKNGIAPQTSTSNAQNYLPNYRKAAANLLLNGAFNVNSTSVAAWRALLSSLSGNVPTGGLYSSPAFSASQFPIYRFLSPMPVVYNATSSAVTSAASPNPWASINILTDATNVPPPAPAGTTNQVTALATAIVKQVKLRGPFLSMADFLNRRLSTASNNFGLNGALQAAIDDPSVSGNAINAALTAMGSATGNGTKGFRGSAPTAVPAQLPANTAIGVPGWLMQQDLVQCFSPVMTVRSDTFLVRCYGEADNIKSGVTEGRAWGEALIQRLPDFVDQSDPALSTVNAPATQALGDATPLFKPDNVTALVDATNQTFGRRFKVISFRWLNESDL